VRLVQGQMGHLVADYATGIDRGHGGRWRSGQTRLRGHDADEEDRRGGHQSGSAGVTAARCLIAWLFALWVVAQFGLRVGPVKHEILRYA
jgi:hypothetical protein